MLEATMTSDAVIDTGLGSLVFILAFSLAGLTVGVLLATILTFISLWKSDSKYLDEDV